MPSYNIAVITTKGMALNAKILSGVQMEFTKAAIGDGSYDSDTSLSDMTDLKNKRQEVGFSSCEVKSNNQVMLRSVFSNAEITEGYKIREFGVYAMDPDEGEILYSITTAVEGQEDTMPALTQNGLVTMTFESYISVSNTSNVTITGGSGGFASAEEVEALRKQITVITEDISELRSDLGKKVDRGILLAATVTAAGWSGDESPYTNTVAIEALTGAATELLQVFVPYSAEDDQKLAWAAASVLAGENQSGALLVQAYGAKPEIDIPINVIKYGDLGDTVPSGGGGAECSCEPISDAEIQEII